MRRVNLLLSFVLGAVLLFTTFISGSAQEAAPYARLVRILENDKTGLSSPAGLAYSPKSKTLYVIEKRRQAESPETEIVKLNALANRAGTTRLPAALQNPLNLAYDSKFNRFLFLQAAANQLIEVSEKPEGSFSPAISHRYDIQSSGILDPQGITVDPLNGTVYILDAARARIVRLNPGADGNFDGARLTNINLQTIGLVAPRGVAFDPASGHLHVLDTHTKMLYELTRTGQVTGMRDLGKAGLELSSDVQGMVFAPSGDQTDDPAHLSLFAVVSSQPAQTTSGSLSLTESLATYQASADVQASSQLMEFSLVEPMAVSAIDFTSALVKLTDMAALNPPSPDPSGITYLPDSNTLLIVDGEVEEVIAGITHFQGANVWELTLGGSIVRTANISLVPPTTAPMTNEPTGVTWNPYNGHYYITDDDRTEIYDLNAGADGLVGTADDTWVHYDTAIYGNGDPEGITYDTWHDRIYIADGVNAEIYEYTTGGRLISHFDVLQYGIIDPETVEFNPFSSTLFVMSSSNKARFIIETTLDGTLIQTISIAASSARSAAGLAYAPASNGSGAMRFYIVDRGIDNDKDPNIIDGKMYEMTAPIPVVNPSPTPTASPTATASATPTITVQPGVTLTSTNTPTDTLTPTSGPTSTSTSTLEPPPSSFPLFASFANNSTIGGINFGDEDLLLFDGTTWSIYFDGSDVGVNSTDVDAFFRIDDSTILLSFDKVVRVGGLSVEPWDIVRFDATSLGTVTEGTFSMFFDGSDVELDTSSEDINALELLPDGRILISTKGDPVISGLADLANEDILAFTPLSLGDNTSGTWSLYLDGSAIGLGDLNEDIDAMHIARSGVIYLSTSAGFSVNGVSGFGEDVFLCSPLTAEPISECDFSPTLYFDGSSWGMIGNNLDAFSIVEDPGIPTGTPTPTHTATATPTATFTPTPTNSPTFTPTATASATAALTPTPTATATNTATHTATYTPTATATATHTATATASPTATATATNTPTPTATATALSMPGIALDLSVNGDPADEPVGPFLPVGSTANWTYTVTNIGNVTLNNIQVSDDRQTVITCTKSTLAPQASMTCNASELVTRGQFSKTATVTGIPMYGSGSVGATNGVYYFGAAAEINLVTLINGQDANTAPGPDVRVGDSIDWSFTVTNPGNVTLQGIIVTDDGLGEVSCPQTSLNAGATMICTAREMVAAGQHTHNTTVQGNFQTFTIQAARTSYHKSYYAVYLPLVKR